MSDEAWHLIEQELEEHDYMTGVERTVERVRSTGEVFTPSALVLEMVRYLDLGLFAPGKTVLDPACGDGQFLVAAKGIKVHLYGMSPDAAVRDLFGVDIMRDNVDLCLRRLAGGTVVMGDSLHPSRYLEGQTDRDRELMHFLFNATPAGSRSPQPFLPNKGRPPSSRKQRRTAVLAAEQGKLDLA